MADTVTLSAAVFARLVTTTTLLLDSIAVRDGEGNTIPEHLTSPVRRALGAARPLAAVDDLPAGWRERSIGFVSCPHINGTVCSECQRRPNVIRVGAGFMWARTAAEAAALADLHSTVEKYHPDNAP